MTMNSGRSMIYVLAICALMMVSQSRFLQ